MGARTPQLEIASAEDSTAIILTGQDDLREHWLWLRTQARREKFDAHDVAAYEAGLARVRRAVEEGLRLASEKRDRAGE
jgi:hypothetical protein